MCGEVVVRCAFVKSGVSLFSLSCSGGCWWLGCVLDISLSGVECLCFVCWMVQFCFVWLQRIMAFFHRNKSLVSDHLMWSRDELDWFYR